MLSLSGARTLSSCGASDLRIDVSRSVAFEVTQQIPTLRQEDHWFKAALVQILDDAAQLTLRSTARGTFAEKGDPDGLHFERGELDC